MEAGLVFVPGSVGNTGGRRAKLYDVRCSGRAAIGLNVTKTQITAVLVDLRGAVMHRERMAHPFVLGDAYARILARLSEDCIAAAGVKPEAIFGRRHRGAGTGDRGPKKPFITEKF